MVLADAGYHTTGGSLPGDAGGTVAAGRSRATSVALARSWRRRGLAGGSSYCTALYRQLLHQSELRQHEPERSPSSGGARAAVQPLNPGFFRARGQARDESGDWDRVENGYRNAIALNPEHHRP